MKTAIIIPAYNESERIDGVLDATKKLGYKDVIVIDDGSQDYKETAKIVNRYGYGFLRHILNLGKGSALKTGCDFAYNEGYDQMVIMDADGQHDPKEIPVFIKNLASTDIVFGSRKYNKKMPALMHFGNNCINAIAARLFKIKLRDVLSGFRAFTRETYKKIRWDSEGYTVEAEMIANTSRRGLRYKEISIKTIYPDTYKGTTIFDGLNIVSHMFWWKVVK